MKSLYEQLKDADEDIQLMENASQWKDVSDNCLLAQSQVVW
jgi:hypothetical protein